MVGAIGSADFGQALRANLVAAGVDDSAVVTVAGASSGMSVAIFDNEGNYGAVIVAGANLRQCLRAVEASWRDWIRQIERQHA